MTTKNPQLNEARRAPEKLFHCLVELKLRSDQYFLDFLDVKDKFYLISVHNCIFKELVLLSITIRLKPVLSDVTNSLESILINPGSPIINSQQFSSWRNPIAPSTFVLRSATLAKYTYNL